MGQVSVLQLVWDSQFLQANQRVKFVGKSVLEVIVRMESVVIRWVAFSKGKRGEVLQARASIQDSEEGAGKCKADLEIGEPPGVFFQGPEQGSKMGLGTDVKHGRTDGFFDFQATDAGSVILRKECVAVVCPELQLCGEA